MKWVIVFAALLMGVHVARAEDSPPPSLKERMKSLVPGMPHVSVPSLPEMPSVSLLPFPDLSMPDFSGMGDGITNAFSAFTQQVGDTLPILEEMGYEVSTFRVQWGLPPIAKLRLRSKSATDPVKLQAIAAKGTGGMLMKALVSSAVTAKRIQSNMRFGTAVIDVDFALKPKVRMSFLSAKSDKREPAERNVEDLELACGQALD